MSKADFPAFMRDVTAARFCDMKTGEFVELVESGALPTPNKLGRWDRSALEAVMRGDSLKPEGVFEL
jgi:predicted DNA-binding transcriptional regulator AlpA